MGAHWRHAWIRSLTVTKTADDRLRSRIRARPAQPFVRPRTPIPFEHDTARGPVHALDRDHEYAKGCVDSCGPNLYEVSVIKLRAVQGQGEMLIKGTVYNAEIVLKPRATGSDWPVSTEIYALIFYRAPALASGANNQWLTFPMSMFEPVEQ